MQMRWVLMVGLVGARIGGAWRRTTSGWRPRVGPRAHGSRSARTLARSFRSPPIDVAPEGVERWRVLGPGGDVHLDDAPRKDGRGADSGRAAAGARRLSGDDDDHAQRHPDARTFVQQLPRW